MSTDPDRALDRLLKAELRGHADPASPASASCIDAETLAAWADGALSSDQAQLVETHLADCARCQALMSAFARTEAVPAAVVPFKPKSPVRWLVPLAAGTIAATLLVWVAWPSQTEAPPAPTQMADALPPATPPVARTPTFAEPPPPAKEKKLDKDKAEETPKRQQAERRADAQPKTAPTGQVFGQQGQGQAGGVAAPPPPPQSARMPPPPVPPPPAQQPPPVATTAASNATADATARLSRTETVTVATAVIAEFSSPDPAFAQPAAGAARGGGGGGGGRGGAAGASGRAGTSLAFRGAVPVRWRVLSSGAVERSFDAGASWQPITIDPPTIRVTNGSAQSPSVCWLIGRDGLVLLTTDGASFARVTPPAPVDLSSIVATSPRGATVQTADGRTFVTTDGGRTWIQRD